MPITAPFSSVTEADNAYFSSGSPSTGPDSATSETGTTWSALQEGEALEHEWVLAYQEQSDGDRQRWFVIRSVESQLEAIQSSGEVYTAKSSDTLAELPHYPTEDDAREAYGKWSGPDAPEQPDEQWEGWKRIRQIDPWWVFSRSHRTEDRTQFLVAGERSDGSAVYLGPNGQPRDAPYLFSSFDAARSAIETYLQAVQDGQIPEEDQPTGDAPSRSEVREAVRSSNQTTQSVERLVEKLAGEKVLIAAGGVAAVYLYLSHRQGVAQ